MSGDPAARPPRLGRAAIVWAARRLRTPDLPPDADELYASRLERHGRRAATRWYRRQALAAVARALRAPVAPSSPTRPRAPMPALGALARELALGLRRLRRVPAHASTFGLVVGVGIAAAAFMVQIRWSMLHPNLGLGRGVRVVVWVDSAGGSGLSLPLSGDEAWLDDAPAGVGRIVPLWSVSSVLATPYGLMRPRGERVRPGYLTELGASLWRGVDLDGPDEIVLSYDLWRARWAPEDPALGATVEVDGTPTRIVGIAAPGVDGPVCCAPPAYWTTRDDGQTAAPAVLAVVGTRDVDAAAAWLGVTAAQAAGGARASLRDARSAPYGGETGIVGRTLGALLALATVTWLATLLSGANLVLTDALSRRRELRLRRALGSRPTHTVLRALAETSWLAAIAGAVALGAGWAAIGIAPWLLPMVGDRSSVDLALGIPALAATACAAVATTFACALPGAAVSVALGRSTELDRGPAQSRFAAVGLGAQVALAGALLVVTGLFTGTIHRLDGDFVGFRRPETAAHYLSAGDDAPTAGELLRAIGARHPRARVALTRRLPVYGAVRDSLLLPDGDRVLAAAERVSPGFFETIGATLVAGAPARTPGEVVVSADVAERMGASAAGAIGRSVQRVDGTSLRVVGVVEAASWGSGRVRPTTYESWGDEPVRAGILLARGPGGVGLPPEALLPTLRPYGVALEPFETLGGLLVRSRVLQVFLARLATAFAVLCLGVALGGVHGHFLHWVRSRARAMSVRVALGAPLPRLGWEIVSAAGTVVVPGVGLGCLAGWLVARVLASFLGIPSTPGLTLYAGTAAALLATAFVGLLLPIARAGRADPRSLLRSE